MSTAYSVFNLQTGELVRGGVCQDEDLALQEVPGCVVVPGTQGSNSYYQDGVQQYTLPQILAKATRPPFPAMWSNQEMRWIDQRTLVDVQAAKNDQINSWRLTANRSSFSFSGKEVACDELSRSDIDGVTSSVTLTGSLPVGFPGAWKAIDNTYVPIPDVATWTALVGAMVAQGTANFVRAQALKAMVAAATTREEVEAITWDTPIGQ